MLGRARLAFWHVPTRRYVLDLFLLENLLSAQHWAAIFPAAHPTASFGLSLRQAISMAQLFAELEARAPRLEWLEYSTQKAARQTALVHRDSATALQGAQADADTALLQAERQYRLYRHCYAQLHDLRMRAQGLNIGLRRAGALAPILLPANRRSPTPPDQLPTLPAVLSEARLLAAADS